jgi:hypothetical protein
MLPPVPGQVVLVEGGSDRVALETLARRSGADLAAAGARVVPMGGITNLRHHLERLTGGQRVVLLHDAGEAAYVQRTLARRRGPDVDCFVCDRDLEDELLRALGVPRALEAVAAAGDLAAWQTLTRQPYHRQRPAPEVLRRFLGTTSGRKERYARLLVDALDLRTAPSPLLGTLAAAVG